MRKPVVMLTNTSGLWEVVGDEIRADSWFGNTDGIHTISVQYSNFVGAFKIQGTLELNPTEVDWFDVSLQGQTLLKYPKNEHAPTGQNGGDDGIEAFTFIGNYTYLRAIMVRDYLGQTPTSNYEIDSLHVGVINQVLLSL